MMRSQYRRMLKTTTIVCLVLTLLLTSCGKTGSVFDVGNGPTDGAAATEPGNGGSSSSNASSSQKTDKTDGSKTPDNAGSPVRTGIGKSKDRSRYPEDVSTNHGATAIMETEEGYYYDYGTWYMIKNSNGYYSYSYNGSKHKLSYYDKESGEAILLCNKPECEHKSDENCVATYKGIVVLASLLYDGEIYIYGMEKNDSLMSVNLYRAALDGSYIDRVVTILEADNSADKSYDLLPNRSGYVRSGYFVPYIIIHRGYAFIPYYLMIGNSTKGFKGGGVAMIDIYSGEIGIIYEMKAFTDPLPYNMSGFGDYVYLQFYDETMKYSISEDEWIAPAGKMAENGWVHWPACEAVDENNIYVYEYYSGDKTQAGADTDTEQMKLRIGAFDQAGNYRSFDTGLTADEHMGSGNNVSTGKKSPWVYNGKLFLLTDKKVVVYDVSEENWGRKLADVSAEPLPKQLEEGSTLKYESFYYSGGGLLSYKICNDRLYRIVMNDDGTVSWDGIWYSCPYIVEYCDISEILAGRCEFKKAFEYLEEILADIKYSE